MQRRPVNKLAALVTGSGWKHANTEVPDAVLFRAKRDRLITTPPQELLDTEGFENYTGLVINTCRVLGLRGDMGGPEDNQRCRGTTKAGWLWVLWCEKCNSVFARRCWYLQRVSNIDYCPEGCRKQAHTTMLRSKGIAPKPAKKSRPLNERPIIKC